MSELESVEHPANLPPAAAQPAPVAPSPPAAGSGADCPTCGGSIGTLSAPSYVYAIGRIEPRFPQLSVEKEFAQATGRAERQTLTHPAPTLTLPPRAGREWNGLVPPLSRSAGEGLTDYRIAP